MLRELTSDSTGHYLGLVAGVTHTPRPRRGGLWLLAGVGAGALATAGLLAAANFLFTATVIDEAAGPPRFVEETAVAGVDHVYDGDFEFYVGGGVAVFDCNDDGRQEIFLAGGANPSGLYRNQSPTGGALRFARMNDPATDLTEVTGAYPLDIDGDSRVDLSVLRHGENAVLRGLGDCRFERANGTWGIDGGDEWTVSFSATWEGPATMPTLAFGNYLADDGQLSGQCADHRLFRPSGTAGYSAPAILDPGWCTLSILFSDWDRSGRSDLRMTNDRHYYRDGEEQLWRVEPGEDPHLWTHAEGWQRMQIWGMGIASFDLGGDGRPEVFLTSQGDNKLQTLVEDATGPEYADIAFDRRATAHRPFAGDTIHPSTAWHPEFQDVNNDTFVDLFVSKGNVEAQADYAARDPNNLLLGQSDGTFIEAADEAGIISFARSRGAALADFNLDGMLDLVVANRSQATQLWRNVGAGSSDEPAPIGNWLAIRLRQDGTNVDAVGSFVAVRAGGRTLEREVTVGGGHAGGQLGWVHFGLGTATEAEVRITWPDGEEGPWVDVGPNQFLEIEADETRRWRPPG